MKINRNQGYLTVLTNKAKAEKIANKLACQGRLSYYLKSKNSKTQKTEYYIFYYCYR